MTREDWSVIERRLAVPWGKVRLLCDGFEVTLYVEPLKVRRYVIGVYIDGSIKGEWFRGETEEGRRFFRPKTVFLYSPRERRDAVKRYGKRAAEKAGWMKSLIMRESYWTSVTTLRRHFEKNNQSIELLTEPSLKGGAG